MNSIKHKIRQFINCIYSNNILWAFKSFFKNKNYEYYKN